MKKITLSILLFSTLVSAQITEVINSGLTNVQEIIIKENLMYISDIGVDKIFKIDITQSNPSLNTEIDIDLSCVSSLEIHNENLIYSEECSFDKIYQYNLNTLITSEVVKDIDNIRSMAIKGDNLYMASHINNNTSIIYKINIKNENSPLIELTTLSRSNSMLFVGDILLIATNTEVYKADTSLSTFSLEKIVFNTNGTLPTSPQHLAFFNDEIYLSQLADNKIIKFNLDNPNPIATTIYTGDRANYQDMIIQNNIMWLALPVSISKLDLATLKTKEYSANKSFKIQPNPTSDYLEIKGIEKDLEVKIFDNNGRLILSKKNKSINISDLTNGIYFVKINGYKTKKIIKEQ